MAWKDKELEENEAKWITGLPTGTSPDGQPQAVHRLPTRKIDPLSKAFTAKSYARKDRAKRKRLGLFETGCALPKRYVIFHVLFRMRDHVRTIGLTSHF